MIYWWTVSFSGFFRGGRFGSYAERFSDGQFHTVAFVVDGLAITQSGVMDRFVQWLRGGRFRSYAKWFSYGQLHTVVFSWWTVRQLHIMV